MPESLEIVQYREANQDALSNGSHPGHARALDGLTHLYQIEHEPAAASMPSAPTDAAIADYFARNQDVLTNGSHPRHGAVLAELTRMHEAKAGAVATVQHAPVAERSAVPGPVDRRDTDAMLAPALTPDSYTFDGMTRFPHEARFEVAPNKFETVAIREDTQMEATVREALHSAGVTPADALLLEALYRDRAQHGFRIAASNADYDRTVSTLIARYGERHQDAIAGAKRVYRELPESLRDFLGSTGFENHPAVVDHIIKAAVSKGYFNG